MARVIPKDELKECGVGWLEYWSKDVTRKNILHGCAWFAWESIEVDDDGCSDTGYVEPDEMYGCVGGWRMWDEKPTPEELLQARWEVNKERLKNMASALIPSLESCIAEARKNQSASTSIYNRTAETILDVLKDVQRVYGVEGEADD